MYARVCVRVCVNARRARARVSPVVDRYTFFSYRGRRVPTKSTHTSASVRAQVIGRVRIFFLFNLLSFLLLLLLLLLSTPRSPLPPFSSLTGRSVSSLCAAATVFRPHYLSIFIYLPSIISCQCARLVCLCVRVRVCVRIFSRAFKTGPL